MNSTNDDYNLMFVKQYGIYKNILYSRLINDITECCWIKGVNPIFKLVFLDIDIANQKDINKNIKILDEKDVYELYPEELL